MTRSFMASQVGAGSGPREAGQRVTEKKLGLLNYQWLQAMLFAIKEVNGYPNILPNITLGFRIYDSCLKSQRAMEGTFWALTGLEQPIPNYTCLKKRTMAGMVGDAGSSCSIAMSRVLGLYRLPQISYFSTSPQLSDHNQFPSFFRTIPSDDFQSRGLAQLLVHFGWTWVGLLAEDNDYGQQGVQILEKELIRLGGCVAFSESILTSRVDRNAFHIVQLIKTSTANAIVIYSSDAGLIPVVNEIVKQNVAGKIWIASESWSTSPLISSEKYSSMFIGSIGFAIHSAEMPGFEEHLNNVHPSKSTDDDFVISLWEESFGCKWPNKTNRLVSLEKGASLCTGEENLHSLQTGYNDVNNLRVSCSAYTAVYAIVLALQDMLTCGQGQGPFQQGSCADIMNFSPWQILHYVKKVAFDNTDGREQFFDHNGDIPAQYDIVNWQLSINGTIKYIKVGSYDSSTSLRKGLIINTTAIRWATGNSQVPLSVCSPSCHTGSRKVAIEGAPPCCFQCATCPQGEISNESDSSECFKCPWDSWPNLKQDHCSPKNMEFLSFEEPLGATLTAISIFSTFITVAILGLFKKCSSTPIVKANNLSLSYLLLFSLTLCFLCSLAFIGYPTQEKCLLRQAAFGITFALCVSCVLAKTIMVVIAFNATKPNSDLRKWIGPQISYISISVCTFIQVLQCGSWLIWSPPFSEYNLRNQPGKILVECNEGSPIAFWCMLGYLWLLSIISFIVAFLARKLPDSFNEAQFITFSMLAFLSVWLSFIPAYLSTRGKYMVAMEIFAILSSAFALVACLFIPKCYIILFKPEYNSKEYLMGRNMGHSS
ncbi:extracellular calcium-sensing receptor-like [Ambystoma mexicanum]|uniref:extracellular calcium-sensing receptor-like n=1 Tax=Ambystoma mexicanum TaxID=8296 RepID=UPI0037E82616